MLCFCGIFIYVKFTARLFDHAYKETSDVLNSVSILKCDLRCVFDSTSLSFQLVLLKVSFLQQCMSDQFTCSFQGFSCSMNPSFHRSFEMTDTCHKLVLKIQTQGLTFAC